MRPVGSAHYNWKGGRFRNVATYQHHQTMMAGHPEADCDGYVMTHRLIAEKVLGRYLAKTHIVHHVNLDGSNNAHTNLVICENQAYHALLHRRLRAYEACGNPNARRCWFCKHWDMEVREIGRACIHPVCLNAYDRVRHARKVARQQQKETT